MKIFEDKRKSSKDPLKKLVFVNLPLEAAVIFPR